MRYFVLYSDARLLEAVSRFIRTSFRPVNTHTQKHLYIYIHEHECVFEYVAKYILCVHTYTHTYIEHPCRMVTIDPFLEVLSSILDSNTKNFEDFMVFLIPLDNCILN
jgi:hypothetical protein